jgi:tripartite-type tricarboxylate transporter receptor subunit TctC
MRRLFLSVCIGLVSALISLQGAGADTYPSRSVRFIVPYPPGAGTDFAARLIGRELEKQLRQPFVVENRPGAASAIGATSVARSDPDGYTMLLATTGTLSINPHVTKNLRYDPEKDFAPVAVLCETPFILVVNPSLPIHNVQELIDYAKKSPGKLTFASAGVGSLHHLSAELLMDLAKIKLLHVPYNGSVPGMTDVISGQISMMFVDMHSVLPQIKSGKVRALGITSAKRASIEPSIPAIGETVPGYNAVTYSSIVVPAGTPEPILQTLNQNVRKALALPDVRKSFEHVGIQPLDGSQPAEIRKFLSSELTKWQAVVKAANIQPR